MTLRRLPLLAGLIAAAFSLSGCVAAIIPLAAGGAIAGTSSGGKRAATTEIEASVEVGDENLSERSAIPIVVNDFAPALRTPPSGANAGQFANLIAYSSVQAALVLKDNSDQEPGAQAAVLSNPAALNGKRANCGEKAPIVLIDLDPEGAIFEPVSATTADPGLTDGLANLRAQGVEIAWLSGLSAADAGKVRMALSSSGLDPNKSDNLLLMRYKTDRKQTRRGELAETHCIIAIAGDTRTDFDELYDYLLEPRAAFALEPIIGNGWFLIPPVLNHN